MFFVLAFLRWESSLDWTHTQSFGSLIFTCLFWEKDRKHLPALLSCCRTFRASSEYVCAAYVWYGKGAHTPQEVTLLLMDTAYCFQYGLSLLLPNLHPTWVSSWRKSLSHRSLMFMNNQFQITFTNLQGKRLSIWALEAQHNLSLLFVLPLLQLFIFFFHYSYSLFFLCFWYIKNLVLHCDFRNFSV